MSRFASLDRYVSSPLSPLSSSDSSMDIEPLLDIENRRSNTPDLEYVPKSPSSSPIQFGTAKHVQPIDLRPVKLEDDDVQDEDKSLVLPPIIPTPFSPTHPAQVQIKIEQFETVHNEREIEGKHTDALKSPKKDAPPAVPSDVRRSLDLLYKSLCTKFDPSQLPPIDSDTFSTRSSGWDEDQAEEWAQTWPTPPKTPIQGDDMHPPQLQVCGAHPGQGWYLNTYGTIQYYRFLIPDPSTKRLIVAPYLSYSLGREKPEVSATYGLGYPVQTRPLTATAVDYICPVITAEQQYLLSSEAPFADAVDNIINNKFPYELAAAVKQFRYFKETQYAIQASIKKLQEKEMRYIERAVGTLSELENANVLGRLLAYDNDIIMHILDNPIPIPGAYLSYARLARSFKGKITHSALDIRVEEEPRAKRPDDLYPPSSTSSSDIERFKNQGRKQDPDEYERKSIKLLHRLSKGHRINPPLYVHARKRCFRCDQWGHVKATCPERPYWSTIRK